jgi:hypothetical protein
VLNVAWEATRRIRAMDFWIFAGVIVFWLLLQGVILPKLGVPT